MIFYTKSHQYYCGIDLHEKTMYMCIVDQSGKIRYHQNLGTSREEFLAAILVHIQNTNSQYNLGPFPKKLSYRSNRSGVADRFEDQSVRKTVEVDLHLLDFYDEVLREVELYISQAARVDAPISWYLLKTIPGVGDILSLVMMYEIEDIRRFKRVQEFLSYCRLVKCARESGGKRYPSKNNKIGNVHLKWAFSEAAVLFLKGNERVQKRHNRRVSKYGKAKALSILASDLGRAVYFMLRRKEPFDLNKFLGAGDVSQTPNWTEEGETWVRAAKIKCIEECETAAVRRSPESF